MQVIAQSDSVARCGNDLCEALTYEQEDASNCFQDCGYQEVSICEVGTKGTTSCNAFNTDYDVTVDETGCPEATGSITFKFGQFGSEFNYEGQRYLYTHLHDSVRFGYETWSPCATTITKKRVAFINSCQTDCEYIELPEISEAINTGDDKADAFIVPLDFKSPLSSPRCEYEFISANNETAHQGGQSCSDGGKLEFSLDGYKPGIWGFVLELKDKDGKNLLQKTQTKFIINQCSEANQCNDDNFFTIDSCEGSEY